MFPKFFYIMLYRVATALLVAGLKSDLVDTWADSVCIHQLIFKPRLKAAASLQLIQM